MTTRFSNATDFRRSLEARLNARSVATGGSILRLRRMVAFDRLLARIFYQEHPGFYLKGGYAMELRLAHARATRDIDLTRAVQSFSDGRPVEDVILEELRLFARRDLGDYFVYEVDSVSRQLDAPYGGARYPVSATVDGRLFARFHVDVGVDTIGHPIDHLQGVDWLDYCGVPAPVIPTISMEQQFAEKIHAYALSRQPRTNIRVKDLVDMLLLNRMRPLSHKSLAEALQRVYRARQTPLPVVIEPPPADWLVRFGELVRECGLSLTLSEAFNEVAAIYQAAKRETSL